MSSYRESEAFVGDEGGANALRVFAPLRADGMEMELEIGGNGEGLSVAMVERDGDEREYLALVDIRFLGGSRYEVVARVVESIGKVDMEAGPLARTEIDSGNI